jgi:hypothetical protein
MQRERLDVEDLHEKTLTQETLTLPTPVDSGSPLRFVTSQQPPTAGDGYNHRQQPERPG